MTAPDDVLAVQLAGMSRDELTAALIDATRKYWEAQSLAAQVLDVPFGAFYRASMHGNAVDADRMTEWERNRDRLRELLGVPT